MRIHINHRWKHSMHRCVIKHSAWAAKARHFTLHYNTSRASSWMLTSSAPKESLKLVMQTLHRTDNIYSSTLNVSTLPGKTRNNANRNVSSTAIFAAGSFRRESSIWHSNQCRQSVLYSWVTRAGRRIFATRWGLVCCFVPLSTGTDWRIVGRTSLN